MSLFVILWGVVALVIIFFIGLFTHLLGRLFEWLKRTMRGEKL